MVWRIPRECMPVVRAMFDASQALPKVYKWRRFICTIQSMGFQRAEGKKKHRPYTFTHSDKPEICRRFPPPTSGELKLKDLRKIGDFLKKVGDVVVVRRPRDEPVRHVDAHLPDGVLPRWHDGPAHARALTVGADEEVESMRTRSPRRSSDADVSDCAPLPDVLAVTVASTQHPAPGVYEGYAGVDEPRLLDDLDALLPQVDLRACGSQGRVAFHYDHVVTAAGEPESQGRPRNCRLRRRGFSGEPSGIFGACV
ncbi:hypothetical protein F4818DRAFT_453460 [Hypoxylon cercidicola]|nr:hypothetical protein F4818DRAFT_453460 [Hypoxylon cercidicola]